MRAARKTSPLRVAAPGEPFPLSCRHHDGRLRRARAVLFSCLHSTSTYRLFGSFVLLWEVLCGLFFLKGRITVAVLGEVSAVYSWLRLYLRNPGIGRNDGKSISNQQINFSCGPLTEGTVPSTGGPSLVDRSVDRGHRPKHRETRFGQTVVDLLFWVFLRVLGMFPLGNQVLVTQSPGTTPNLPSSGAVPMFWLSAPGFSLVSGPLARSRLVPV